MLQDNICKYIGAEKQGNLSVHNFVLETRVPHSHQTQLHNYHTVYLVVQGKGLLRQGNARQPLEAGTLFFTFAQVPFVIENTRELQYFFITFSGARAQELFLRFGIGPADCLWQKQDFLIPLWQDSLLRADKENIDLLSESILLYTLSKFKNGTVPQKSFITVLLSYLEQHFTEQDLTLQKVAQALGYNEKYLSHAFKKHLGTTFSAYLRLLRLKQAVLLMENGVTSVKNVAWLCGYADPLYFSKVFRQEVGCSPKTYLARKCEDRST